MGVRRSPKRRAQRGVRVRADVAAVPVLAATLTLAAGALLWLLQSSLRSSAGDAASARAAQIALHLLSDPLPEIDPTVLATNGRTTVIQVLDTAGRVVASSAGAPTTPLVTVHPTAGTQLSVEQVDNTTTGEGYRVAAAAVSGAYGAYTLLVAMSEAPIDATLATVATLLAVGFPVIVLVGGIATYRLVGTSLRPVERIRQQVSEISTADLCERVAVPPAGDEISRLARTMNAMLARIEAGHTAQRRFVGDASHELRSPLATVTTALELASTRADVLKPTVVAQTLLPEAHRMQHLVEDLLLLARADENALPLHLSDVDLDDVLDTEARRLRAGGRIQVHCTVPAVRVRGDGPQLGRVVRNLADNAARHARTQVTLTASTRDGWAVVVIADDGPGIPEPDRARIFDRFMRLDTDRGRSAGGTGLGLAIVAEIVAAHHGTVMAGAGPHAGAQFTVRLPVTGPAQPPSGTSR